MTEEPASATDQEVLREIVEGTTAEIGEGFFAALVQHLARAARTRCAWVTEWLPEERRLRALSFWSGDHFVYGFEYGVEGTPCGVVIDECRRVFVPERVMELYPDDPDLPPMGAVSYLGFPLIDTGGRLLGHLAVIDDAPMHEDPRLLHVFRIFAARAAAELRRIRRDRDIHEREEKLSRLFDSAMDGIVELDGQHRITRVNAAAEKIFGCDGSQALGSSFLDFLGLESRQKVVYLTAELDGGGARSLWIPDGLRAVRRSGEAFSAEATVSRFELGGRPFYSLIMRDVEARDAAEERLRALMGEAAHLRAEIDALQGFDEIVGRSPALAQVLQDVERVARADTSVLITGETGTGKELIARAIHRRSDRAERPLVTVNCAAIATYLQESEFFGHEKGAFTGATQRRDGRFKLADGGTIFLDEVGEMGLDLQAKLLRVLQAGEFEPVGGARTLRVDVRVVAATNRDLEEMVRAGTFRADLLYRLNVFPIHVPPLRERGEDVVLLAERFARRLAERRGRTLAPLTADCRSRLMGYEWPGNVRELHNVIERALITSTDGHRLNLDRALPEPVAARARGRAAAPASSGGDRVLAAAEIRELERANVERALLASGGKLSGKGGAAALLGLNPNTLASRMRALGIRPPRRS